VVYAENAPVRDFDDDVRPFLRSKMHKI